MAQKGLERAAWVRGAPAQEALHWRPGTRAALTLAVLPAGEEAVARGAEALVAALGVSAGVLAQAPHPALVQVWPGHWLGVMEAEKHAESQAPMWPLVCQPDSGQATEAPDSGGPPLLPAPSQRTWDSWLRRARGVAGSGRVGSSIPSTAFAKALGEAPLP